MARLKLTIITTATFLTLAACALTSLAQQQQQPGGQQQGGGRGGPGGGRGGPGGGFGGGFGGGGFNSLLGLASNEGIQKAELKTTDKQKAAIKGISDKIAAKTRELTTAMGFGGGGPGGFFGGGPGGGPGGGGNGGGGGNNNGQGGGRRGAQNGGNGGGGGGNGGGGNGGGGGGNGGGRGGRFNMTPEQQEQMQEFRDTMTQLRTSAEQSLGKILDKKQVARLKQIQLQLDPSGPWIVLREDMIEKLNLTEEQVAQLTEMRDGQRQVERDMRKTNREAMDAAMKKANPDFQGFGFNGGNRGNRGNRGNNNGNAGNAGGNNGGGQNGNRGNQQQFDPAAFQKMRDEMQKMNEMPEVKEEREKQQAKQKALENDSYAMITKALYPRQRATLKSLVGPTFDRTVMGGGGPFGRFGGGGPGGVTKNGGATNGQAAAKANPEDEDEAPAATAAPPKPAAPAKPAATSPKRKSLRELRGDDE